MTSSGARRLSPTCSSNSVTSADESIDELEDQDSYNNHSEADTNFYEAMKTPAPGSQSRTNYNISQRKKLATPSPRKEKNSSDQNLNESMYSSLSSPVYSTIGSPVDKKVSSMLDFSGLNDISESFNRQMRLDYNSAKVAASEIARSGPPGPGVSPIRSSVSKEDRRRSRCDLKKRLKQLALTSETGSASVIEVIEPNSSEEEEFKKSMQEMNFSWGKGMSQAEPQTPISRNRRIISEVQPSPAPSSRTSKTSESSAGSLRGSKVFPEPSKFRHLSDGRQSLTDLSPLRHKAPELRPKNLLRSEPDILSGVVNARQDSIDNSIDVDEAGLEDYSADDLADDLNNEDLQMLPYDLETEQETSLQYKKKGFLQKLSISKWAQKKRSSKASTNTSSKSKEIPVDYLRETYLSSMTASMSSMTPDEQVIDHKIFYFLRKRKFDNTMIESFLMI